MGPSVVTYTEVIEGVRAAIAAYAQALDDGRTDDLVATFCADGVAEIPGSGTFSGQEALQQGYARFTPRSGQRHVVVNTLVTEWTSDEATAISDFLFLLKGKSGWSVQMVGRYHDTLSNEGGAWRFKQRTMTVVD